jgi:hypothetical protein
MNAVREALADKYHQYRIPSLEEVLEKTRGFKREFPNIDNLYFNHLEKNMTKIYNNTRRQLIGLSAVGVTTLTPYVIPTFIIQFKEVLEKYYTLMRKALEETNKVPRQEQDNAFNSIWVDEYVTDNKHQEKLKREEEVKEPLVTPVPKEMGTTNPLVKPDVTETINPLARK